MSAVPLTSKPDSDGTAATTRSTSWTSVGIASRCRGHTDASISSASGESADGASVHSPTRVAVCTSPVAANTRIVIRWTPDGGVPRSSTQSLLAPCSGTNIWPSLVIHGATAVTFSIWADAIASGGTGDSATSRPSCWGPMLIATE